MRTVGIVGSRYWTDFDAFCEAMPSLEGYDCIVSGGQRGVDTMARELAGVLGKMFRCCLPILSGKAMTRGEIIAAMHDRNQRIVDAADLLIAFPGPRSVGTYDTIRRAKRKGIEIIERKAPV